MQLWTRDKRLRLAVEDERERKKLFGTEMAKKLKLRLDALGAAESLAVFLPPKSGPERCHELEAALAGIFSVDLKHPYRLLFQPTDDVTLPDTTDLKQRWGAIRSVELLRVEDTHGR